MIIRRLFKISFCLLIFSFFPLYGDNLGEATESERLGDYEKAFYFYKQWLDHNSSDSRFKDVFFKAAPLAENTEKMINFYLKYADKLSGHDLFRLYYEVAQLYELTFRYSFAADYYRMALNESNENHPELQLHILKLLYQSGFIPEMEKIDALFNAEMPPDFYVDTLIFKAEILQYQGQFDEAENILIQSSYSDINPEIQFSLWEIYKRTDNNFEADRVFRFMHDNFPDSVELSIMEGRTGKMARLSDFFLKSTVPLILKNDDVYIQIGIFSLRDNALILKNNLKDLGFDSLIVQADSFYKVLIHGPDKKTLLDKLKNVGIKGFTVNYP